MMWELIAVVSVHVFFAWLCIYLRSRKAMLIGVSDGFDWGMFGFALLGAWIAVPEIWDTSWMDKYIEEDGQQG